MWADTVKAVAPKVPSARVPLADKLPTPEEVVADSTPKKKAAAG